MTASPESGKPRVSRKLFLVGAVGGAASLLAGGTGYWLGGRREEEPNRQEPEAAPSATLDLEVHSLPVPVEQPPGTLALALMLNASSFAGTAVSTETPTATSTATPRPTETATSTMMAILTPTPDLRPNLCAPGSFVIPQTRWKDQVKVGDVISFFQEQTPARTALFEYLENPGMGNYSGIRLRPETVKPLDIPPEGDDQLVDLVNNLRSLLIMTEEVYGQATQNQLRIENGDLQALQSMLYRKREENAAGQIVVKIVANQQEIEVTRQLLDDCHGRWDGSPIAVVEGLDEDSSRLIFAFDGLCGNLFLAIKLPPSPTPTATATPPQERDGNGGKRPPTATAHPPQPPVKKPTATAVPPQGPVEPPKENN